MLDTPSRCARLVSTTSTFSLRCRSRLRELREVPDRFDETEWREGCAEAAGEQLRGEIPDSTLSVIELDGVSVGRLRVTHDGVRYSDP